VKSGRLSHLSVDVLTALLEARGLPSHLFGALGPRMHQLLLRSSMSGSGTQSSPLVLLFVTSSDSLFDVLMR